MILHWYEQYDAMSLLFYRLDPMVTWIYVYVDGHYRWTSLAVWATRSQT
jgi:hypothetical protein